MTDFFIFSCWLIKDISRSFFSFWILIKPVENRSSWEIIVWNESGVIFYTWWFVQCFIFLCWVTFIKWLINGVRYIHEAGLILFISHWVVVFVFYVFRMTNIFFNWWLLVEFEIFDIFNVISKGVDNSGVNTVLETECFCECKRVIMRMYLYGGGSICIEFDDHFDRVLLIGTFIIILCGWVMCKWGVENFFDNFMRLSKHDLNLS